jgi:hypothetical protein
MCCMMEHSNRTAPRSEKPGRAPNTQGRILGTPRVDLGRSCHHERPRRCRHRAPCLVRIHRRHAGADHRGGRALCVDPFLGPHSHSRFVAGSAPFRSAFPSIECNASTRGRVSAACVQQLKGNLRRHTRRAITLGSQRAAPRAQPTQCNTHCNVQSWPEIGHRHRPQTGAAVSQFHASTQTTDPSWTGPDDREFLS